MNTHTPGKWEVADYLDRQTGKRSLAVWVGQDKTICLVSPKESETEEDYANAELIASAPQLKADLETANRHVGQKTAEVEQLKEMLQNLTTEAKNAGGYNAFPESLNDAIAQAEAILNQ